MDNAFARLQNLQCWTCSTESIKDLEKHLYCVPYSNPVPWETIREARTFFLSDLTLELFLHSGAKIDGNPFRLFRANILY